MRIVGTGAAKPDELCPDDFRLDINLGLALVASALGANDAQARPAAVLATWSVAGEVEAQADESALERGAQRAHEAIERLSAGWGNLLRPAAMTSALRLVGARAQIAHVGRCRVSRVRGAGLEALTQNHDLATECALIPGAPDVPPEIGRVPTRVLGGGATSRVDVHDIPVDVGDELLLATPALMEQLEPAIVRELCRPDQPLVPRAIALWDHARALDIRFAFILARVVDDKVDGEVEPRALGGSRRPEPSMFFAPGAPLPPPDMETARGPDSRWFKEIANPLRCVVQGAPGGGRPRAGAP